MNENKTYKDWFDRNPLITGGIIAALLTSILSFFIGRDNADYIHGLQRELTITLINEEVQHSYDLHISNLLISVYSDENSPEKYETLVCDFVNNPNMARLSVDIVEPTGSIIGNAYDELRQFIADLKTYLFGQKYNSATQSNENIERPRKLSEQNQHLAAQLIENLGFCRPSDEDAIEQQNDDTPESVDPPDDLQDDVIGPECTSPAPRLLVTAKVSDRASGVYSRPRATTNLTIEADEGYFLDYINLIEESYRNRPGNVPPVSQKILEWRNDPGRNTSHFSSEVACTNSRGAGRTCLSEVTVEFVRLPVGCPSELDITAN